MPTLDTVNNNAALVLSYFDITMDDLNILTTMAMVGGEDELAEKLNQLVKNIAPTITIEEEFEEQQLSLFPEVVVSGDG